MKCAKVVFKEFTVAERPEWRGLVREECGLFPINQRHDADAVEGDFCPTHARSVVERDIPKRIKLQIYVPPHVAREFKIFETEEEDRRSRNERQVPESLRQSTTVIDEKNVDVSLLVAQLKSGKWYIYRLRVGKKQKGLAIEVSLAQPGYQKPPAAISMQALEAIADRIVWPAEVRVYRNTAYTHPEYGDMSLHSAEIVRVEVGNDMKHKLHFADGLWTLTPASQSRAQSLEPSPVLGTLGEHPSATVLAEQK